MMNRARLLIIIGLTAALFACGQKGPLVLPDKQKPKRVVPSTAKPFSKPASPPAPAQAPVPSSPAPGADAVVGSPPGTPAPASKPTPSTP